MNAETWQADNNRYLAASVSWLRLQLEQLAEPAALAPAAGSVVESTTTAAQPTLLKRLFRAQPTTDVNGGSARPTPLLLEDYSRRPESSVAQAQAERESIAAQMDPPPALIILSQQLGLTPFEQETLLLCVAVELDTRIAPLCARAQDDPQRLYPTFALALALFAEPSWDALSPDRPLRYWRLLEINQPGATSLTLSSLRADERIVNYVKGLSVLDDRLALHLAPLPGADAALLAASQRAGVDALLWHWQRTVSGVLPVAQLLGTDGVSKQLVAQATATALHRHLYHLNADSVPTQFAEVEALARLWQRESRLLPLALYIDAQASEPGPVEAQSPLNRFLVRAADASSVLLLGVRDALARLHCPTFAVDVDKPSAAEQQAAWVQALDPLAQLQEPTWRSEAVRAIGATLSSQFRLNLPEIFNLSAAALADASATAAAPVPAPEQVATYLWDACRALTRPRLDTLAQRLEAKATWDDLVLPEDALRLLRQIAIQVRHRSTVYEEWGFAHKMTRGLGINALFTGESGTGKTMAAEVIANDLRLNLYRIDLSAVVSKYIGETEKNLRRLFDAADEGGAILFFDEADALFGKRSEVKDSHDRYANIEINYLLQRIEAYRGLAILATNMKSALDPAFMRRLRFIVHFPFPGLAERKLMWQKVFPPQVPKSELAFDRLARLNLTGGNIHSIALNAAFLAAQAGEPVTTSLILSTARMEYRKLEKPINESDFRL